MKVTSILGGILGVFLLAACSPEPAPAPPATEVTVVVAQPTTIDNVTEVPGRVQAIRTAQVRARVNGIVQRRLYTEGSDVKAGQKLFIIDPSELTATLHAAEATLMRAEATAANADEDIKRYKDLIAQHVISQQAYDTAVSTARTAQADVAQSRAQVETARLNLSYTVVTAPIAGRARRAEVTEGALVSASSATLLTIIEQLDPIYVNFSQSSADLLSLRRDISDGTLKVPELSKVKVNLAFEDGSDYPHVGHMDFLDLSIDETTGTAAMRAEFPNPNRILLPGQFVRARVAAGVRPNGYLLPQRAVKLSPQGASVMLVDKDSNAASHKIEVGALRGGSWEVLSGLQAGDRVIIDGLQKIQPGSPVHATVSTSDESASVTPSSDAPAANSAAATNSVGR